MIFFVSEVMYTFTLGMVKASILFLYERIFRSTSFQKLIWATQVFNLALVLAFVSSDFVQCRPLSYFWTSCEFSFYFVLLSFFCFIFVCESLCD